MIKPVLLIIDDEIDILELLGHRLEEISVVTLKADNPFDALRIIASGKVNIHCIVSDIKMPGLSGVELLKKLRQADIDIPCIFFTGFAKKEFMIEALKLGAFDFIEKDGKDGFDNLLKSIKEGLRTGFNITYGNKDFHKQESLSLFNELLAQHFKRSSAKDYK